MSLWVLEYDEAFCILLPIFLYKIHSTLLSILLTVIKFTKCRVHFNDNLNVFFYILNHLISHRIITPSQINSSKKQRYHILNYFILYLREWRKFKNGLQDITVDYLLLWISLVLVSIKYHFCKVFKTNTLNLKLFPVSTLHI